MSMQTIVKKSENDKPAGQLSWLIYEQQ